MCSRGKRLVVAVALSGLLPVGLARAAQEIYLEVPGVSGESTAPFFPNQIEVLSASFAAANPACGKSLINVSELIVTKMADKASIDLLTAMRDHTVFPLVTLRFVGIGLNTPYQKFELSDAVFSSNNSAGGPGETRNLESWTISFSQAVVTYQYIDGNGKASGPPESVTIIPAACPGS